MTLGQAGHDLAKLINRIYIDLVLFACDVDQNCERKLSPREMKMSPSTQQTSAYLCWLAKDNLFQVYSAKFSSVVPIMYLPVSCQNINSAKDCSTWNRTTEKSRRFQTFDSASKYSKSPFQKFWWKIVILERISSNFLLPLSSK